MWRHIFLFHIILIFCIFTTTAYPRCKMTFKKIEAIFDTGDLVLYWHQEKRNGMKLGSLPRARVSWLDSSCWWRLAPIGAIHKLHWQFLIFSWPSTHLHWHFLPYKRWQKFHIFWLPNHFFLSTYIVFECPHIISYLK